MKRFSSITCSVMLGTALVLAACVAPPPRVAVPQNNSPVKIEQSPLINGSVRPKPLIEHEDEGAGEAENEAREEAMERKGREELYWLMRTYPGDSIPEMAIQKGYAVRQTQLAAQMAAQRALGKPEATTWQAIGPAPILDELMGDVVKVNSSGRMTMILVHPTNANIVYAAGAQGGVWKTTNGGDSWTPLTDGQASLAVGTMAFDPNNAEIIYVGTGEPHGSDSYYGVGILKSTNGGASWSLIGTDTFAGLGISDIVVSRNDPNTLYVAASSTESIYTKKPRAQRSGIYKSTNGGSTWAPVYTNCNAQGTCASPSAVVVSPTDPNTLFAGIDFVGVIKTTNGGANWATSFTTPDDLGRIEVAISPANANVLYAGLEVNTSQGSDGYLFRSTNGGTSWEQLTGSTKPLKYSYCGGQCSYDNFIVLHPTNTNIVFAGGNALYSDNIPGIDGVLFRSINGGAAWTFNAGTATNTTLHPDLHAIAFAKSNPNIIWVGTDGGLYRSSDGGATWQDRNTGLATLQFQSVALHPTNPQIVFGGMQDNSKARTNGNNVWTGIDRGDGGFTAIDPFDPKFWYGTRFGLQFQRNEKNGSAPSEDWPLKVLGIPTTDRMLFYVPFAVDPNTAGRLYWGTQKLYRTNNRGDQWSAISPDLTKGQRSISAIAVMPGNANVILTGASDGSVQVTTNGGTNWTDLTKSPLPNRYVSDVAAENAQTYYAAFNGFNENTVSTPGHVFKTTDGGATWSNISKDDQADGLPDLPVQAIVLDGSTVYAGTDLGVYRSTNGGDSWEPFSQGMPNVAVFDLALQKYASGAKVLAAATHGRGMWRVVLDGDIFPVLKNKIAVPFVMRDARPVPGPTVTPGPSPTSAPTQTPTPTQPAGGSTATPTPTQAADNTATPTPTQSAGNTPTPTPTTPPSSGSISGQVRFTNAGVSVHLRLLDCTSESNCTSVATTTSASGGQYQFNDPPDLQSGSYYRVAYYNGLDGNANDTTRIDYWRGPTISSYSSGDSITVASFSIANVILTSPAGGATTTLPQTFSWVSRGVTGDVYTWQLANFIAPDSTGTEFCYDAVGALTSSTLIENDLLNICFGDYDVEYAWYVYVGSSTNDGYGSSYYFRTVTFSQAATQATGGQAETKPKPTSKSSGGKQLLQAGPRARETK